MVEDKLSTAKVIEIVEAEGLGYAVMDYMGSHRIADEQLAELWARAAMALDALDIYLTKHDDPLLPD